MTHISPDRPIPAQRTESREVAAPARSGRAWRPGVGAALLVLGAIGGGIYWQAGQQQGHPPAPPMPHVTVSRPLLQTVTVATSFLGQFSAADMAEMRAQVGGTLTSINFTDGQIVHKGDLLFTIDPRPYQVRLQEAVAQLQTSQAKKVLTGVELWRAQQLKRSDYGTAETVDQRDADERSAEAAIDSARAGVNDAALDLEYAHMVAPFTGRIGAHLVSVGNLVSGSRGGVSATTLLATLVSLDPIYLDFDMSEADFIAYQQAHPGVTKSDVVVSLDGDGNFNRHGTLDFIDNSVNRGSGTIHLRATVPNPDMALTPGEFARLRVAIGKPSPALLVPASAVVPDQSQDTVMIVGDDGKVRPRIVQTGTLYRGLRIIKSGIKPDDRVIIDGLMLARPGSPVVPMDGAIKPDARSNGA
jgi:membrane fusion protein, multidrug efflux system